MQKSSLVSLLTAALFGTAAVAIPNLLERQNQEGGSSDGMFNPAANWSIATINDPMFGQREVSYYITPNHDAVIDGDVYFGSEDQLKAAIVSKPEGLQVRAHSVKQDTFSWPNNEVVWKFVDKALETAAIANDVNTAIARWKAAAPYLKFTQKASGPASAGMLNIKSDSCGGCWSNIGFGGSTTTFFMNLQPFTAATSTSPACSRCGADATTHEFGHALGLAHEHQRPDRDNIMTFHCENVNPTCNNMAAGTTCCNNKVSNCCTKMSNFNKVPAGTSDATGAYDLGGLMQYPAGAFALPGKQTLIGIGSNVVPTTGVGFPSNTDVTRICKLYHAICPKYQQCKAQGCPANCAIIKPCSNGFKCNSDFPPACCDPDNSECQAAKDKCAGSGCGDLGL